MKTVKVRIAVAVDSYGQWSAFGDNIADDDEAIGTVDDCVGFDREIHWLTAELPIPEAKEVAANVEGGESC